ncbi:MAG: hypothetical protein C4533_00305 [Candidatus Omnitrophota bacterium]|jgi:hypothetical protein|nr:MAG: hypothetical protein C4533_00305 [Candidatus Omnitrophota bacterium]
MYDMPVKIIKPVFLSIVVCLLCQGKAVSAPCYGARMPKKNEFHAGASNYSILKRYLENEQGKIRSSQNFFDLSYGLYDWLSIDLKGGTGNIKQHPVGADELDYPSSFAGGYGFRIKFFDRNQFKAVCGFQHISVHPEKIRVGQTGHAAILDDWQFSVLISRQVANIDPYIGVKLSRTDYIHRQDGIRERYMSDLTKNIGLFLGIDLPITERCWFNIEAQFVDVQAFAGGIKYSF